MLISCRPAPPLRHFVRYYYQVEGYLPSARMLQPVPARSPQILEFMFGTPYAVSRLERQIAENARPIALVGAQAYRRVDLILQGKIDAFTIVFQPGGVAALFSIPAGELTNADFEAEAVLGYGVVELHNRLADVSCFADRVRVADSYLFCRRPTCDAVSGICSSAAEVIRNSGHVRVADLAERTGLGIRQFERRFRHEIGMAPKLYARVVRFEAALCAKAAAPGRPWTDIAHALGYHDQMHMVHDFKQLAGDSPARISGHLDVFVKPEAAIADRRARECKRSKGDQKTNPTRERYGHSVCRSRSH